MSPLTIVDLGYGRLRNIHHQIVHNARPKEVFQLRLLERILGQIQPVELKPFACVHHRQGAYVVARDVQYRQPFQSMQLVERERIEPVLRHIQRDHRCQLEDTWIELLQQIVRQIEQLKQAELGVVVAVPLEGADLVRVCYQRAILLPPVESIAGDRKFYQSFQHTSFSSPSYSTHLYRTNRVRVHVQVEQARAGKAPLVERPQPIAVQIQILNRRAVEDRFLDGSEPIVRQIDRVEPGQPGERVRPQHRQPVVRKGHVLQLVVRVEHHRRQLVDAIIIQVKCFQFRHRPEHILLDGGNLITIQKQAPHNRPVRGRCKLLQPGEPVVLQQHVGGRLQPVGREALNAIAFEGELRERWLLAEDGCRQLAERLCGER
uniref:Uncharacterized protein n=1 Tax=Anopheles coluzzii TaxID=1518534 RepID=A0A8W7PH24_ANOCL